MLLLAIVAIAIASTFILRSANRPDSYLENGFPVVNKLRLQKVVELVDYNERCNETELKKISDGAIHIELITDSVHLSVSHVPAGCEFPNTFVFHKDSIRKDADDHFTANAHNFIVEFDLQQNKYSSIAIFNKQLAVGVMYYVAQ